MTVGCTGESTRTDCHCRDPPIMHRARFLQRLGIQDSENSAVEVSDRLPYQEIATFLHRRPEYTERAFRTLSYFDNLSLVDRIRCPVLMTVGLQDLVCPPSTPATTPATT